MLASSIVLEDMEAGGGGGRMFGLLATEGDWGGGRCWMGGLLEEGSGLEMEVTTSRDKLG